MTTTVVFMILILFQPPFDTYQDIVAPFNSMQECLEYKKVILRDMKTIPSKYYILVCEKPISTTTMES